MAANLLPVMCLAGESGNQTSAEARLFSRAVGDQGQSLVVVRGAERPVSLLKGLGDSKFLQQAGSTYEVRVELHTPKEAPLVLASRLRTENHVTEVDRGIVVLNCRIDPGQVALATAEGHALVLWQIGIDPQASGTHVTYALRGWQAGAAADRLDGGMVSVTLERLQDGRLTAEVLDKRPTPPHQHTRYEQIDAARWEFARVRQWRGGQ